MLLTCRSSVSVDLRVYIKNFLVCSILILYWQTRSHAERGESLQNQDFVGGMQNRRRFAPTIFLVLKPFSKNCGVCWTKFETISSKIQMIKADSAGRNNLSGGMDSPCLGSFPARRRGLGRNAGGFRGGGFRKFGGHFLNSMKFEI